MSGRSLLGIVLFLSGLVFAAEGETTEIKTVEAPESVRGFSLELISVQKIWDRAPHNAFTDLIRFQGQWYCAFREGSSHVSNDSVIRVIRSKDGDTWESAGVLGYPLVKGYDAVDIRDAKLSVTPAGELMLNTAAALIKDRTRMHQSICYLSSDGTEWKGPFDIGVLGEWMWRTVWHKGIAYNFAYTAGRAVSSPKTSVQLYRSKDGIHFDPLGSSYCGDTFPNEHKMVFTEDGTCYVLVRRDGGSCTAQWGTAQAPYDDFSWKDLGVRMGGPEMLQLPNGQFLAAVRLYDNRPRTSLCWIDERGGAVEEVLTLPSGGDTSYAGMVLQDDILWISYYSSHEKKTSIYLAKVRVRIS